MSNCKSCGAKIRWAVMPSGKRMPFDAEPITPPGWYVLDEARAVQPPPMHLTHYATCPNADEHRK